MIRLGVCASIVLFLISIGATMPANGKRGIKTGVIVSVERGPNKLHADLVRIYSGTVVGEPWKFTADYDFEQRLYTAAARGNRVAILYDENRNLEQIE